MSDGAPPAAGKCDPAWAKRVPMVFRIVNIGLCVFMCATAIDSLSNEDDESAFSRRPLSVLAPLSRRASLSSLGDTDAIFVALYVFLFAFILFVFEAHQFSPKPIKYVDDVYRANFGFMYKPLTKAIFLIFVGFLQFGLDSSNGNAMGLSCGVLTIADGVILTAVYCKDSTIFDVPGEKYTPPTIPPAGSDMASV